MECKEKGLDKLMRIWCLFLSWMLVGACFSSKAFAYPEITAKKRLPIRYQLEDKSGYQQLNFPSSGTPERFERQAVADYFSKRSFDDPDNAHQIQCRAKLYLPAKQQGPLPVLVLSHGLRGVSKEGPYEAYRKLGNATGYAVLIIEHFASHGYIPKGSYKDVFLQSPSLESSVIDLYQALRVIKKMKNLDEKRVVVLGVSRGDIVADILSRSFYRDCLLDEKGLNFAGLILNSPFMFKQERELKLIPKLPIMMLLGKRDYIMPYITSWRYAERLKEIGHPVRTVTYEHGYHGLPKSGYKNPDPFRVDISSIAFVYDDEGYYFLDKGEVFTGQKNTWSWGGIVGFKTHLFRRLYQASTVDITPGVATGTEYADALQEIKQFLVNVKAHKELNVGFVEKKL